MINGGLHFRTTLFQQRGETGDDEAVLLRFQLVIARSTLRCDGLLLIRLILIRQKKRCGRAVGFRDDPDFHLRVKLLVGKHAHAWPYRDQILLLILGSQFAPITSHVPKKQADGSMLSSVITFKVPRFAMIWPSANNGFDVVGGRFELSAMILADFDRVACNDEVAEPCIQVVVQHTFCKNVDVALVG